MILMRILAPVVALSMLLFVGCSGDDDNNTNGPAKSSGIFPSEVLGSWTYVSVTVNGSAASLSDALEWVSTAVSARLSLIDDGDYAYSELDASDNVVVFEVGTVTVTGNNIVVIAEQDNDGPLDDTYVGTYSLSNGGETLTLTVTIDGDLVVFTLQ